MTPRRPHGTGSVYEDKARGRWVGTYEAGWTANGTRRRRKVVGRTEREAKAKLREALRKVETEQAATGGRPTVKRWAEDWLATTQRTLRPSTWATNRSAVALWIVPTIGHKRLDSLTPADVRAVSRAILDAGRKPSTAHRAQSVLEKMLRDAIREGHHVPERALMVVGPGVQENDRDAIPLIDVHAILKAAEALPDYSRWLAAFLQGMRPAECRGLRWSAIDFDAAVLDVSWQLKALPYNVPRDRSSGFRVPVGYEVRHVERALHLVRPKTKKGQRLIPLTSPLADALQAWRDVAPTSPAGLVWPAADSTARTADDDLAAWIGLQDAAQVARVEDDQGRRYALYECRHSTATLLRELGADDQTITAIMGHASILSTKAYLHVSDVRTREVMSALAERLQIGS